MADPNDYEPSYTFTSSPSFFPAAQLNTELLNIALSTEEIVLALMDVRRSDGALKNGIVTVDSLNATTVAYLTDVASGFADAAEASANSAAGYAATAATSAGQAMGFRNGAQAARDAALYAQAGAENARDDSAASAGEAAALVQAATAGFTGWPEGEAYDFGYEGPYDAPTYFNRDWGYEN